MNDSQPLPIRGRLSLFSCSDFGGGTCWEMEKTLACYQVQARI